ncbi:hypothetical protein H5J22_04650 [Cetobacterium sp. 8H]|uniref:hypothetical protein n=1 Tax=Cetobacterium sp. 8H TaxID=2759681 RepID=UPI00163D3673|nr:hypothetical protein [Cetobacterium sp. 8H]MBC2850730.1 hypothetical protein [Cetobacterium sp. 8H]
MLKKTISTIFLFSLFGCTTLPELTNPMAGSENANRITTSFDSENEILGIGSSKIGSSGTLIANGKASKEAKDKLKNKILEEEDIIFKSFLVSADPYIKKILSPALPDLMDYTATQLIQKSVEKDSWVENNKSYAAYTLSKTEILAESQNIFTQYIDDITSKLQIIKEGVVQ